MLRKIKLAFICGLLLLLISACGNKSDLTNELGAVALTKTLPEVSVTDCVRLADADDAVYEQQIAACEMYCEAYELTKTSNYIDKYKDDMKKNKIAYYCNSRRKDLQLDIDTALSDNINLIVGNVVDCDNIDAYVDRVNYDVENFYDYYSEYINSGYNRDAVCKILRVFYQRSNIFAFRFMAENKNDFIVKAVEKIEENSNKTTALNMYIAENNDIIKALNSVYGGIPSEYVEIVTRANIILARRLLESDSELSEDAINSLMHQLGEPTPSPEPTPEPTSTPEPTEEPPESITQSQSPVGDHALDSASVPTSEPEVYIFGE